MKRSSICGVPHLASAGLLLLLVGLFSGCEPQRPARIRRETTSVSQTTGNSQAQLLKAMDYLERLDEFDHVQAIGQTEYQLNRWVASQTRPADWKIDPLSDRLPKQIREGGFLKDAAELHFTIDDAQVIQEAVWLRDIARRVSRESSNPRLQAWLNKPDNGLSALHREQLAIAERLFDWIVRNVQLEATLPYAEEVLAPAAGGDATAAIRIPPPQRAIPGPGYRFPPWKTLLYGYGDALQRARVFILMCRQQGIDVAYVAFPGQTVPPRPRPWVPAVLLGSELYLFDCELGLPIPGPAGEGIATLSQVIATPELLDTLSVEGHPYPVKANDLKEMLALIDVAPTAFSLRMKLVENNLAGAQRTILTTNPSDLAARLQKCKGITATSIWSVPYETMWFETAMHKLLEQNPQIAQSYFQAVGVFQFHHPLVQGRHLHFVGVLNKQADEEGVKEFDLAKEFYLKARVPKVALENMQDSKEIQKQMGLVRGPQEGDFVWQARVASARMFATQSKQHATYWLGLAHYESGNYDAAVQWLKGRTLEADPPTPWTAGARYNLARTYEVLGDIEAARELYLADDSPQQHGNRLRAKLLQQWQQPAAASE